MTTEATEVHIYRAARQPATRFTVFIGDHTFIVQHRRRTLIQCFSCRRRRRAANLFAQVYYDGTYFYCKPGKGCKADRSA